MMGTNKWVPSAGCAGRNKAHGVTFETCGRVYSECRHSTSGELGIDCSFRGHCVVRRTLDRRDAKTDSSKVDAALDCRAVALRI
jgi:hypothetical protein